MAEGPWAAALCLLTLGLVSGAGCSVQVVVPFEDRGDPELPGDGPKMADPHEDD